MEPHFLFLYEASGGLLAGDARHGLLLGDSARAAGSVGLASSSSLLHRPIIGAPQLKGVNHQSPLLLLCSSILLLDVCPFMFVHGRLHSLVLEQRHFQVSERSYEAAKISRSRSD